MNAHDYDDGDALPWGPVRTEREAGVGPYRGSGSFKIGFSEYLDVEGIAPEVVAEGLRHVLRRLREKGWIGGRGRNVRDDVVYPLTIVSALGNVNRIPNAPFNLHVVARACLEDCVQMDMRDWNEIKGRAWADVESLFLRAIYVADHFQHPDKRSARA